MIKKITFFIVLLYSITIYSQTPLIVSGDIWDYYDVGNEPLDISGNNWKNIVYDVALDANWKSGPSRLGYGNDGEVIVINNPITTAYFRKVITVADATVYGNLNLEAIVDDGMVVYLNGVEVWRDNMPTGTPTYATLASPNTIGDATTWLIKTINNSLVNGSNVIAVEIHNITTTSSDMSFDFKLTAAAILLAPTPTAEQIPADGNWRYLDNGSDQGTAWTTNIFDDSTWSFGLAELGYGDSDEATTVSYGGDSSNKYITTYFRKEFSIADTSIYNSIDLEAVRDDAMVVYLNGVEVWRNNIAGTVTYTTTADVAIANADESAWLTNNIASTLLVNGTNVIAVEIHQYSITSSDISFNFKLTPSAVPVGAPSAVRGPYLQTGTPTSIIVKWRTNNATDSKVNYGTSLGALNLSVSDAALTTEHEITLTGLTPNTKYYYEIANASVIYVPQESGMYVITSPNHGTKQFVRMWALGDAGTADINQANVRDSYYNYVANTAINPNQTDMMLFLGDNAYDSGTDTEYQNALFDVYDVMLKKSVAWATLGNHDGYSASSSTQTGPYYDIFTLPIAAEAGGTASGTEAYYSFDYANIHFIVLESYTLYNDATQIAWSKADIEATNQDWIVALFHHPPYTKGSHDSDTETELIAMRNNFLLDLEANGVDLILNGHSHSYERSFFINGHYGTSDTFSDAYKIQLGSGRADGDGAYLKTTNTNGGAVYITTGSAGKTSGGTLDHAAMYYSENQLGSTVVEISDNGSGGQNLDVKFITDTGTINDYFTMNKASVTLGTESFDTDNDLIKVYPVPANSLLNIEAKNGEELQKVTFFNTIGALVKETEKQQINIGNLKAGMYMLLIETNQQTYYKSIIIN